MAGSALFIFSRSGSVLIRSTSIITQMMIEILIGRGLRHMSPYFLRLILHYQLTPTEFGSRFVLSDKMTSLNTSRYIKAGKKGRQP